MRKNKFWALDVPDLHPHGFQHCGNKKIRLYSGGDGGGGGGDAAAEAASLGLDTGTAGTATGAGIGIGDASGGVDLGGFEDIAAADAASAQTAAEAVADAVGMSGFESTGFLGASPAEAVSIAQEIMGINPAEAAMMASQGQLSTGQGLTQSELGLLSELGLGNMAISDNQTVDQALASFAVHGFLNEHIGSVMGAIGGPVVGAVVSASNALAQGNSAQSVIGQIAASIVGTVISNVTGLPVSAQTVTSLANGNIGQAALGMGIAAVSQATGLPQGAVAAAVNGNYGAAVANTVTAAVIGETAQAFGGPLGGLVGQALGKSETTQSASQSIANAINNTSFAQELGNATASLSQSIASVNIGVPGGIGNVASAVNTGTVPSSIDLGAAGTLTIAVPINTSPATGSDMADAQDALANKQLQFQYKIGGAAGLEAYLEKSSKANESSVFTNVWTNLSRDLAPYQKPPTTPVKTTAEFEAAERKVAALRLYEEQTGQTASQATLDAIFSAQDPLTFADRLYTTAAEAKDLWRSTVGTEPTEYDLLGLIGLDTGQVTSQVQGIADDRASVSSEELDEFLRDIGKGHVTLTPDEQMDLLGGSEVAARNAIVGKYNAFVEDKNTTLGSEAEELWKKAGLDPASMTMDDLAMMVRGSEATAETYAQRLADVRETTFKPVDDFAKQAAVEYAAMKAGYNTYEYGGQTFTVRGENIAAMADGRILKEYQRLIDGALTARGVDLRAATDAQVRELYESAHALYGNDISQLKAASIQDFINGNTQSIQQFVDSQPKAGDPVRVEITGPIWNGSSQTAKDSVAEYVPVGLRLANQDELTGNEAQYIELSNGKGAWVVSKEPDEVDLPDWFKKDVELERLKGQNPWETDPEAALFTYAQFDTPQKGGAQELIINSAKSAVDLIQNIEAGTGGFVSITPEGKETLVDVVATAAKAGGNVVKNFSDLIWATGLVERDNVAGATANALIRYSDSILSTDAKTQQDNILKAINSADTLKGKYDALMDASKANPWGAALIAGGEIIEELPTLLAGGAVGKVAAGIWGKGIGFAAARGTDAGLSAGESAGVGYAETYDNIIKAGGSAEYAASQAAKSAFQAAAITFGSDLVGDAALVKKFMGDLKDLSVGQLTKIGAKQFVTEGFEEGLQNISTQYNSFGTVDMNQAMNAFTIGSVLGTTTAAGILAPGAINYNAQVALGLNGEGVTLRQVIDGTVQIAPGSFDVNAVPINIGGASVSLGDFTKVVDTSLADPDFSLTSYKTNFEGLAQIDYGGSGLSDIALAVTLAPDANTLTTQLQDMGLSLQQQADVGDTKFDNAFTSTQEVKQVFANLGYTPTETEINQFVGSDPNVSQSISTYVDQNTVTEAEARAALQSSGIAEPTQEMVNSLVGNYNQNQLATKANEMLTGYMTAEQTNKAVRDAIAGIQFPEGLTTEDVTKAITDYMAANPGLSATDVTNAITSELAKIPAGLSSTDVKDAIDSALTDYATKTDITNAIANIQFPEGVTKEEAERIVNDAIDNIDFPASLTEEQVGQIVADGISKIEFPQGLTEDDVRSVVSEVTKDFATKTDIESAIAGIKFPAGITKEDVTKAISDFAQANPGLSAQDVAAQVNNIVFGTVPRPTAADATQALRLATSGQYDAKYDTNGDGRVTLSDALAIQRAVNGDTSNFAEDSFWRKPTGGLIQQIQANVDKSIKDAIADIQFPQGLTTDDVASEIKKYMEANPGLSATDVTNAVAAELVKLPAYATPTDVTKALDNALKDFATKTDIETAIKNIQFPAGITKEDVAAEIKKYAEDNPGLSLTDVTNAVTTELGKLPDYATPTDVTTAIENAIGKPATEGVNATGVYKAIDDAIAGIQFPQGLTKEDVAAEIKKYAEANPGLSTLDVTNAVAAELEKLPAYATPDDVTTALNTALADYATKTYIDDAIKNIEFPAGITKDDVSDAIKKYMEDNPGLSATDVTNAITTELAKLPAGLSSTDVKNAIDSALTDYATKSDITDAIAGIQFPEGVTKAEAEQIVSDAIDKIQFPASLTEEQVGKIVADGISKIEFPQGLTEDDVKGVVDTALADYATKTYIDDAIKGIEFPQGLTKEDVAAEIKSYAEANPGLSLTDVTNAVAEELKKLPDYATPSDVTTAIENAVGKPATEDDAATGIYKAIDDAIAGIQFPAGITKEDVAAEIKAYAEANPGLSTLDVTNAVAAELKNLPAYATPADVTTALDTALKDYATKTDIENAIKDIKFPQGLTKEDVAAEIKAFAEANPGLSLEQVTTAITTELGKLPDYATPADVTTAIETALAGYATQANVNAATKTLQDAIDAAQAGNTTRFDEIDTAIQALRDAGLTEEQVRSVVDTSAEGLSTQFKDALDAAVAGNTEALGTLKTDLETKIGDVQTALETALGEQGSAFGKQVTALMEQGQSYQEAVNTALESLGTDIGSLGEDVATKLADLGTTLGDRLTGLESQLGDVETRLAEAIQTAKDIGLEGDQALEAAINSVATDLGTTKADLLTQLGTTEEALRSDFATELGAVREELGGVETRLTEAIQAAKDAGLEGDAALDAAIRSVASDLGTTKDALLEQIGTTEQALRDDFATQLGEVTTELGNVETRLTDAIATAEAAGLSRDQAIEVALNTVAADLGTTKEDLLSQLGTVESTLRSEIEASQAALGEQVAGVETRLTEAIAAAEAAGQTRDQAIETALNQVATDLGTTKEDLLGQLGTVESGLRGEIEASQAALGEQITGVESRLTEAIADAEALGLTRDQAIQAAVDAVAADLGTTREGLLEQLGTTEATLRADLEAGLGLVGEQLTSVETRLKEAIDTAEAAGLSRDEAIQSAVDSVAADLGTTREDLLSQIGATEATLRSDLEAGLGLISEQVAGVEQKLTEAIAAAEAAGLSRDEAIQAAVDTVAADLGTTREGLLEQLGTTEEALRAEFAAGQEALSEQLTGVEQRLAAAIQDAKDTGLAGDAALQAAIDSVAGDLGTTREDLLSQLGTTEEALRTDFATQLGEVTTELGNVETRLTDAIAAAEAAGLSRDEAIQAGLDAVAADLGTTREDLLSQLGTTEEALRTEFTSGLTGLETALGEAKQAILDQMAAYEAAGIERDQALDLAITGVAQNLGTTKDDILSRLGTTEDALRTEFQAGQEALGEQLTGVEGRLTQAIAEAEAAGLSRDEAIQAAVDAVAADLGTTREGLLAQLGTTEAALRTEFQAGQEALGEQITTGIGGLQTALAEAETRINDRAAQYEAAGLARDQALQQAIADVATELGTTAQNLEQQLFATQTSLSEQITGVQTGLQQQIQDVATVLGKPAQAVTQADIDLVNQMIGGQVATDLTYDANRDGVIDQNDVAFLTSITTGTEPPEFPAGTRWAPTGVYGQIAGLGQDLTRQLEQQELERVAREQAAAEEAERAAQGRFQAQQQQQRRQQFANMLMQPGGMTPQMVQVKTPDVLKLGPQYTGIYDTAGSIFRSPEQEKLFMSPYGQFFDGGEVTEDELLEIVRG